MPLLPTPLPNLTVVGTGMKSIAHVTLETLEAIQRCDKLLHVGADVVTRRWFEEQNSTAEQLPNYLPDRPRQDTYALWVDRVLAEVRTGARVCAAAYGHPGMYVNFTGEAMRRARAEGYETVMLPGISAEATLMSDLLVDPAGLGWQSYGATLFLRRRPRIDVSVPLVLSQVKVVESSAPPDRIAREGLARLTDYLLEHYPPRHEVLLYEAIRNPVISHLVNALPLSSLPASRFRLAGTLYVPPLAMAPVSVLPMQASQQPPGSHDW